MSLKRVVVTRCAGWSLACLAVACLPASLGYAQFGGMGGDMSMMAGMGGPGAPPKSSPYTDLQRVVTATVAPDSWDMMGGPGTIQAVDRWGVIVVSQTEEVHQKIANLLAAIRQVRAAHAPHEATAKSNAKETPQGDGFEAVTAEDVRSKPTHARIQRALDEKAQLEFVDTPLEEVIAFLSEAHKIPILIDSRALEEIGLGNDTPISIALKEVSLRSALRLMLQREGLTYVVSDEVLKITSAEVAESQLLTRVYPVQDLAVPTADDTPSSGGADAMGSPGGGSEGGLGSEAVGEAPSPVLR